MSKPISVGKAMLVRKTEEACLFRLYDDNSRQEWIPNDGIHEDSPLHERCLNGSVEQLVLTEWICERKGLI